MKIIDVGIIIAYNKNTKKHTILPPEIEDIASSFIQGIYSEICEKYGRKKAHTIMVLYSENQYVMEKINNSIVTYGIQMKRVFDREEQVKFIYGIHEDIMGIIKYINENYHDFQNEKKMEKYKGTAKDDRESLAVPFFMTIETLQNLFLLMFTFFRIRFFDIR